MISDSQAEVTFKDITGAQTEVTIDVTDYRAAADCGQSLSQYYANRFPTAQNEMSALEQFSQAAGLRLRPDHKRGIRATSMKEIVHGGIDKSAGTITRPDGSSRQTTAGRILFPEIMMQMVDQYLITDKEDVLGPWEGAIALRDNVIGPRVDQPLINTLAPESSAARPIAQLAEPSVMVTITLGEQSFTIPTKSIGLQISDQALQSTTIDMVAITLAAQARGERIRRIEEDMVNIVSGDTDYGIAATTFVNGSTYDSAINGTTKITHKGWIKFLRANYQKMSVSHALMDIDTFLLLENRDGKPTVYTDLSGNPMRLPGGYSVENANIPTPTVLLVPTSIIGANQIMAFDSRYALRQITNISASYQAIESFVLRRVTAMRFDYGTALFKFMPDAFQGLTLGA